MVKRMCYTVIFLLFLQGNAAAQVTAIEEAAKTERGTEVLPETPSNLFLEAIPSSVLAKRPIGVTGNVVLESEDGQKVTIARAAAELSETLKNTISDVGTAQPLPIKLSGNLFTKLVDSLKELYEFTGVNVYQLSYPLKEILSEMSFDDALSLFIESNRLNLPSLTWYIAAFFATMLYENKDLDQLKIVTEKLAKAVNGSSLITSLLNSAMDKNLVERLLSGTKVLAKFEIPLDFLSINVKQLSNKNIIAITGTENGAAYFWNLSLNPKAPQKVLVGHTEQIRAVELSSDGNYALTGSTDKTARYWDLTTGNEISRLKSSGIITALSMSSGGERALIDGFDSVYSWNLKTGEVREVFKIPESRYDYVQSIAMSHDGKRALAGLLKGDAYLFDLASAKIIKKLKGPTGSDEGMVRSVAFSVDDNYALTGSHDAKVILWNLRQEGDELQPTQILEGATQPVVSVAFSSSGKKALTGSFDLTTRLWDLTTGKIMSEFKLPTGNVVNAVFGLDEESILTSMIVPGPRVGAVYQWAPSNLNKLPQVVLLIKLKQLGKDKVLESPYFKEINEALPEELHAP